MQRKLSDKDYGLLIAAGCGALIVLGIWLLVQAVTNFQNQLQEPAVTPAAAVTARPQQAAETVPGALELVDQYRASKHLAMLFLDPQLTESAQAKADDLVANQYWAHNRLGATSWDWFAKAGYVYSVAGENLAKCWPDTSSVVNAWIASPTHEAVLTGNYQDVGFGIAKNPKDGCNYVVAHFGTRQGAEQ
ncbi:CAP domain-containing protein [Curtobacterium sp. MCSS17_007]|uniref:CAP domain-containing protein n=1 Tax=Curtobacterium sp. MCSS17_007 TaxID=2175646 RepID=UPI000DA8EDEF|nr:CAP domain-containing protein [Curtobacterium sp. MCSS17_007]WIE74503.1 CAP domain-containing protein [Curtobacterium sp. MCSS17_007]